MTLPELRGSSDAVARIDGHPVSREQLGFHLHRLAPTVQNELQVQQGPTAGPIDWTTEVDGVPVIDVLRDRALDEIARDTQILLTAHDLGLTDAVDFADLTAAMARENANRAAAVSRGEVVHGMATFDMTEYYTHTLAELRTRVQEELSADESGPLYVTEQEVAVRYRAEPEAWAAHATTYDLTRLTVPVTGDRDVFRSTLSADLAESADLAAVATRYPGAEVTTERLAGGADGTARTLPQQEALAQVAGLTDGQIAEPLDSGDRLVVYRVDAAVVDEARALTEYATRIRATVLGEKFDAYIRRCVDSSEVIVDQEQVQSIELEVMSS